jgi:DNA-binding response OmpR family regulator
MRHPTQILPGRLLLLATDRPRGRRLAEGLARRGLSVEVATDTDALIAHLAQGSPDAVLLMPGCLDGADGTAAVARLRAVSGVPCMVIAPPGGPTQARVAALDAGADEILHDGIPLPEAIARIRAVLRRSRPAAPAVSWQLRATGRRLVAPSGEAQRLTSAEFALLAMLAASEGAPVDRDAICTRVFRRPWRPDDRAVDSLVKRLRRKMPADAIQSVRGIGYVLTAAIAAEPPAVAFCAPHAIRASPPISATYSGVHVRRYDRDT